MFTENRLVYFAAEKQRDVENVDAKKTEQEEKAEKRFNRVLGRCATKFQQLPAEYQTGGWREAEKSLMNGNEQGLRQFEKWIDKIIRNKDKIEETKLGKVALEDSGLLDQAGVAYFKQYDAWREMMKNGGDYDSPEAKKANGEFAKFIKMKMKDLPNRRKSLANFQRFQKMTGAGAALEDFQIQIDSKHQDGFKLNAKGLINQETFLKMTTKQQEEYLAKAQERYDEQAETNPEINAALKKKAEKLVGSKEMPGSYKKALKEGIDGKQINWKKENGENYNLLELVGWVEGSMSELALLQDRFEDMQTDQDLEAALAEKDQKLLDKNSFLEGGRERRREYLDNLEQTKEEFIAEREQREKQAAVDDAESADEMEDDFENDAKLDEDSEKVAMAWLDQNLEAMYKNSFLRDVEKQVAEREKEAAEEEKLFSSAAMSREALMDSGKLGFMDRFKMMMGQMPDSANVENAKREMEDEQQAATEVAEIEEVTVDTAAQKATTITDTDKIRQNVISEMVGSSKERRDELQAACGLRQASDLKSEDYERISLMAAAAGDRKNSKLKMQNLLSSDPTMKKLIFEKSNLKSGAKEALIAQKKEQQKLSPKKAA